MEITFISYILIGFVFLLFQFLHYNKESNHGKPLSVWRKIGILIFIPSLFVAGMLIHLYHLIRFLVFLLLLPFYVPDSFLFPKKSKKR